MKFECSTRAFIRMYICVCLFVCSCLCVCMDIYKCMHIITSTKENRHQSQEPTLSKAPAPSIKYIRERKKREKTKKKVKAPIYTRLSHSLCTLSFSSTFLSLAVKRRDSVVEPVADIVHLLVNANLERTANLSLESPV